MKKHIIALALMLCLLLTGCADAKPETETAETLRFGALTGPTAMGAVFLPEDYPFTLCGTADELMPLFLQGELDAAAVPLNLASVLYARTGGEAVLAAVCVRSVLYICEYGSEDIRDFSDLRGKTIYATGKGATPEYFLRDALAQCGLDADKDVELVWKSEPGEVVALLTSKGEGVAMLPQPYVTAAEQQLVRLRTALSLADAWEEGSECVTAGIVVRRELAEQSPELSERFLADWADSVSKVNASPAEAAQRCEELGITKAAVAEKAIPYCGIASLTGEEMHSAASATLSVICSQNPAAVGGALPGEDFYYGA